MIVDFPDNPDVTAMWSYQNMYGGEDHVTFVKSLTDSEKQSGAARVRLSPDEFMLVCEGVAKENPDVARGLARFYGRHKMRLKRLQEKGRKP